MKDYYCPLCGTRHETDKVISKILCKCGKRLKVKITDKIKEVTVYGVTDDDFLTEPD